MDLEALTDQAVQAAREAGEIIRSYQDREFDVLHKEGGHTYASQVVTEVDRKAQDAILQVLGPPCEEFDLAVLTEESEDDRSRLEMPFGAAIRWTAPCPSFARNPAIPLPLAWWLVTDRLELGWYTTPSMTSSGKRRKERGLEKMGSFGL